MNLGGFIDTFKDAIARRVVESYPPLYRPSENGGTLPRLLRRPLGAQADAIKGAALSLQAHRGHHRRRGDGHRQDLHRGRRRAHGGLPEGARHLPRRTWCGSGSGRWRRRCPLARAVIVTSITDLEQLRLSIGSGPLFAVMSRERAKLSYRWTAAVIHRWATSGGRLIREEETGEPFRGPLLPRLHGPRWWTRTAFPSRTPT